MITVRNYLMTFRSRGGYVTRAGLALARAGPPRTRQDGGSVIISAGSNTIDGYEPVGEAGTAALTTPAAVLRRPSALASRRAVLHVRDVGDVAVPRDIPEWFTERAFHFYVAGVRVPDKPIVLRPGQQPGKALAAAFEDLDAASRQLREVEGMASIIVSARGRGALAAALWRHARGTAAADALILQAPRVGVGSYVSLDIDCPVLVLVSAPGSRGQTDPGRWSVGRRRAVRRPVLRLGRHVTWLRLAGLDSQQESADRGLLFTELGRWLGAYMYGQLRDQLL
jgi:hypothetical protein